MIRLTINSKSKPEIHLFNQPVINIGCESSLVDLVLPIEDLQPIHLKIVDQGGISTLVNLSNDPFVSINGHPFGKKILTTGDTIYVRETEIVYENLQVPQQEKPEITTPPADQQTESPEKPIFFTLELPFENSVTPLKDHELQSDHLARQLTPDTHPPSQIVGPSAIKIKMARGIGQPIPSSIGSIKDAYLRDLDDDNQSKQESEEPSHLYQAWKWILFFLFSVFTLAGITGAVIYFTVSDKTEAQETKGAQGVADIAMALTYAGIYEFKPNNQNWSDIDFLKTNLQALLPDTFSYAAKLDFHGQFNLFPYSLRVYTNSDLSHFLLIAQPAPSFLQWLIPKSVILVDSHSMELRTIKDVCHLNRLLANPDPLDGANGREISALVKECRLLDLSSLANENNQFDFTPPKNLNLIKSGAENYIYNAPRYYRLGQGLIEKAVSLTSLKTNSQDVISFKRCVGNFSRLQHLILYTPEGRDVALRTKHGLKTFASNDKISFGYLALNPEGKIQNVNLLKEEDDSIETINSVEGLKKNLLVSSLPPIEPHLALGDEPNKTDADHPIYIQLSAMARIREDELKQLALNLKDTLDTGTAIPDPRFELKFQDLLRNYLAADRRHESQIKEAVKHFYKEYEEIPIKNFISLVNESGCGHLINQQNHLPSPDNEGVIKDLEALLNEIKSSSSLNELDSFISSAFSLLTFDRIDDCNELVKYQNFLRNQVLVALEKLLLPSKSDVRSTSQSVSEKEALDRILDYARIINPEERELFLNEFDNLGSVQ
jgi:hypothetical protein